MKQPAVYATKIQRLRRTRHGVMLYNPLDILVGRSLDIFGEYAESSVAIWRTLVLPGMSVIEVGANIGAHTVFFAQAVGREGRVFAFEPQRLLSQTLNANLALNDLENVVTFHAALGKELRSSRTTPFNPYTVFDSTALSIDARDGEPVSVSTLDGFGFEKIGFIKVSAAGREHDFLLGAVETIQKCGPVLYLDAPPSDARPDYCDLLKAWGYRQFRHDFPIVNPVNFFEHETEEFAGAALRRVLAVPPAFGHAVEGLQPIE